MPAPPFSFPFDLVTLSERSTELVLAPGTAECAAIAEWLGILAVERFTATIRLKREGGAYRYEADFAADVVQGCVVTLDPVRSHLQGDVKREYRLMPKLPRKGHSQPVAIELDGSDDETEMLSTSELDLAAPLLEELTLSLDPYPRAPGVAFEPPKDTEPPLTESPFAVLAKLKERAAFNEAATPPPRHRPRAKPKS